eukprot:c9879_g1_i2.p1 GENE.c9879_g1_i2~~c9879_g1_i2.p1  ORF type:complete len:184 (-),score=37.76 c9879_g1_i2:46-597(-)
MMITITTADFDHRSRSGHPIRWTLSLSSFASIKRQSKVVKRSRVADFGCVVVHAFDLVSNSPLVTACDMAHTPLLPASVDIAVFCLSLMGTNFGDFLIEANRVLKPGGVLLVAEVASRIESVKTFLKFLDFLGFGKPKKLEDTKMFLSFQFVRTKAMGARELARVRNKIPESDVLKPCTYKKR